MLLALPRLWMTPRPDAGTSDDGPGDAGPSGSSPLADEPEPDWPTGTTTATWGRDASPCGGRAEGSVRVE